MTHTLKDIKLTKNQKAVYDALLNQGNWRLSLKSVKKETGLIHNG